MQGLGRAAAFASASFIGGAGLVYGIKSSVTAAASFENSLSKMVGLAGVTTKQMGLFRTQLLALAPAVGRTPQELADALYFINSSGISASKALGVLTVSAKAATAGLGDTATVADAVTSAVNAYGINNLSAAKATDVLVSAVREGKGEASSFAPVIGNVTALASQLGVSFDQVGAALAAMTRLGTSAELSATQLQAVFSALLKITPAANKELEKVGLSGAGLRKELGSQGLLATLQTLQKAFEGNITGLAQAFPNVRALRAVLALVGKQADATAGIFDRMKNTTGSLDTAFSAVSQNATVKFAKTKAAIDAVQISIGAALLPTVGHAADAVSKWASKTDNQRKIQEDVNKAVKIGTSIVSGFKDALGLVAPPIQGIIGALGGLQSTVEVALVLGLAVKAKNAATSLGLITGRVRWPARRSCPMRRSKRRHSLVSRHRLPAQRPFLRE